MTTRIKKQRCQRCSEWKDYTHFSSNPKVCNMCLFVPDKDTDRGYRKWMVEDIAHGLPEVCSVCGARLEKGHQMYLCNDCKPVEPDMKRTVNICWHCPWLAFCERRVKGAGLWVLCEKPRRIEKERAEQRGIDEKNPYYTPGKEVVARVHSERRHRTEGAGD